MSEDRKFTVQDLYGLIEHLNSDTVSVLPLVGALPGVAEADEQAGQFVIRLNPAEGGKGTRFSLKVERL